jgi:VPDSG-CTERM motif
MKKYSVLTAAILGIAAIPSANASNITIFDGVSGGGFSGGGAGVGFEDNEVEAGALATQAWDLEAFDLNGTSLSLWGGYNFVNGVQQGSDLWTSGDIFIDINGDAQWGAGTLRDTSNSYYKYDYAIVFGRNANGSLTGAYNVVALDANSTVEQSYDWGGAADGRFDWSNPYRVRQGNTTQQSGTFDYAANADASALGLLGATHNRLTVDVGFLGAELDGALFHFTMECGNDNLMGRASVPDGGAALCMLGLGVGAIGVLRRRMS